MKESFISQILNNWANNFYTVPLLLFSQIALLVTYNKTKHANSLMAPFKIYAIAGLLLFLSNYTIDFLINDKSIKKLLFEFSNGTFTFVELLIFGTFYSRSIKTKVINYSIPIFVILFSTIYTALLLYISFNSISRSNIIASFNKLVFVELIFWGLLSVLFYFELFKFYTNENLLHNPAFWLISFSILYTLVVPICFLILEIYRIEEIDIFNILISIHYFSLMLVYIGIIKALKCNTPHNR